MNLGDVGQFFVGVAALVTAVVTLVRVTLMDKKVDTLNELTIGELGAANETRRIRAKEDAGETLSDQERRHIADNGGKS